MDEPDPGFSGFPTKNQILIDKNTVNQKGAFVLRNKWKESPRNDDNYYDLPDLNDINGQQRAPAEWNALFEGIFQDHLDLHVGRYGNNKYLRSLRNPDTRRYNIYLNSHRDRRAFKEFMEKFLDQKFTKEDRLRVPPRQLLTFLPGEVKRITIGRRIERFPSMNMLGNVKEHQRWIAENTISSATGNSTPHIPVEINGHTVLSLWDSGAAITFCKQKLAETAGLKIDPRKSIPNVQAANGSRMEMLGGAYATLKIGNTEVKTEIQVTDDRKAPAALTVGWDTLKKIEKTEFVKQKDGTTKLFVNDRNVPITLASVTTDGRRFKDDYKMEPNIEILRACGGRPSYQAVLSKDTILQPRTDNRIACTCAYKIPRSWEFIAERDPDNSIDDQLGLGDEGEEERDIWETPESSLVVGNTLVSFDENQEILVQIRNWGRAPIMLPKGTYVAKLDFYQDANTGQDYISGFYDRIASVYAPLGANDMHQGDIAYASKELDLTDYLPPEPAPQYKTHEDYLAATIDWNGSLLKTDEERKKLWDIIMRNKEAFVDQTGKLGEFKGDFQYQIKLKPDAKPFQDRPRRMTPKDRAEQQKIDLENWRLGVIQPSTSNWCSQPRMAPKKDGTTRYCIDLRRLNASMEEQYYNLPNVPEQIELAATGSIFSSFDMTSAFHQIVVEPGSRDKLAFSSYYGLFEFVRMPFGVKNAPYTFHCMMMEVKKELNVNVLCYLDDIIIFSDNMDDHLRDIEAFLEVMVKRNLKLKMKKCQWACEEIRYLGYMISKNCIKTDPKRAEAIQKLKPPTTYKELLSLHGCLSYNRTAIRNFAKLVAPISDLMKKDNFEKGLWTKEAQAALDELKKIMLSQPTLSPPDYNKTWVLETDGSKVAVGAALYNLDADGKTKHLVACQSRRLSPVEQRYAAQEIEALAVVYGCDKFKHYIYGAPRIIVRTDNTCVKFILTSRTDNTRMAKFQLRLQGYNLEFEHVKGKNNTFCDHLSRYPDDSDEPDLRLKIKPEYLEMIRNGIKKTESRVMDAKMKDLKPNDIVELTNTEDADDTQRLRITAIHRFGHLEEMLKMFPDILPGKSTKEAAETIRKLAPHYRKANDWVALKFTLEEKSNGQQPTINALGIGTSTKEGTIEDYLDQLLDSDDIEEHLKNAIRYAVMDKIPENSDYISLKRLEIFTHNFLRNLHHYGQKPNHDDQDLKNALNYAIKGTRPKNADRLDLRNLEKLATDLCDDYLEYEEHLKSHQRLKDKTELMDKEKEEQKRKKAVQWADQPTTSGSIRCR